ncbi:MAG: cobyrinate a,c-diamide synthase, partial [Chloroflexi bacterium]|nr:cobyrinate a,c-diamide synthase [Chloroflexota bacterium]
LFDGFSGRDDAGSTAEVAKLVNAPVILIIDAGSMARSAAAIALGYARFDPILSLKGYVVNNIASQRHFEWVKEAIEQSTSIPVVGYLPRDASLKMPERHLGLVPTPEMASTRFIEPLAERIEKTIDVNRLAEIARSAGPLPQVKARFIAPGAVGANIAIARDEAFSFYYQDNLDLLESFGASLLPFSPLHDGTLPEGAQGIYLGGGFPEMYAGVLSSNRSMIESVRRAALQGMPLYGECGGLMYLSEGIIDFEGRRYPMVGLVPGWSVMRNKLARMGYVELEFRHDTILGSKGTRLRGHEFHWSEMETKTSSAAYQILHPEPRSEGYAHGNIMASYVHLHFGTEPGLARAFVEACSGWAHSPKHP